MEPNMNQWSIGQKVTLPWNTKLLKRTKKNAFERMIGSNYICIREASDEQNGILLRVLGNAKASHIMLICGQPFFQDESARLLEGHAYSSYSFPTLEELKEVLAILRSNPSLLARFEGASMPIDLKRLFWVNETTRNIFFMKKPVCYNPSTDSLCTTSGSVESCRLSMVYFNTQMQIIDFVTDQSDATAGHLIHQTSDMAWKKWVLPAVIMMAAVFYGGYLTGKYSNDQQDMKPEPVEELLAKEEVPKAMTPVKEEKPAEEKAPVKEEKPAEAKAPVKEEKTAEKKAPVKEEKVAEKKAPVKEEKVAPSQPEELPELDQYEAKDKRVRTGAYRIVGTDREIKAKAGDNLTRISKRIFGPGMECYVEVYNDIKPGTPLKAGQTIKIPKLERKKRNEIRR